MHLKGASRPLPVRAVMLKTRVLTACVLVAGLLAALFLLPPGGWLMLASLVCGGAAWEWGGLGGFSKGRRAVFAVLMGAACLLIGVISGLGQEASSSPTSIFAFYAVSALFWLLVVPVWLARKWRLQSVASVVAVGLVVLLPSALAFAHLRAVSPWLLLSALGFVAIADIAAYFSGRAFGRHKLAPAISPGKTWEGAAGASIGTADPQ